MENKLRKILLWLKTFKIRKRQEVSGEEILEEIELQNFNQARKSIEEVMEDTILQDSLSKDEKKMFTGETERKPRKRHVFGIPIALFLTVPALLHKDALNPNLPLFRGI